MRFEPNERQALFLWRMITGETPEEREPSRSNATPNIQGDRKALFDNGFLSVDRRKGNKRRAADHLILTEKAWAWASRAFAVEIMHSEFAAHALQGLLRRLLPFLKTRDIALAEVFSLSGASKKTRAPATASKKKAPATASKKKAPAAPKKRASAAASKKKAPAAPKKRAPAAASKKRGGVDDRSNLPSPSLAPEPTWTQIETACMSLGGGARKARVRLSALREALPSISRQQLDTALIALQRQQRLVLYRDDNTRSLTPEEHAAALTVGDSPRHLVYLEA
jgi:hypothetical protein